MVVHRSAVLWQWCRLTCSIIKHAIWAGQTCASHPRGQDNLRNAAGASHRQRGISPQCDRTEAVATGRTCATIYCFLFAFAGRKATLRLGER